MTVSLKRIFWSYALLASVSVPAQAEEKIWYCEMTGFAETSMEGVKTYKLEKFKMKVTPTEVTFGSGGYFGNVKKPITWWYGDNAWRAFDKHGMVRFEYGQFHFGFSTHITALAMSARCDDF